MSSFFLFVPQSFHETGFPAMVFDLVWTRRGFNAWWKNGKNKTSFYLKKKDGCFLLLILCVSCPWLTLSKVRLGDCGSKLPKIPAASSLLRKNKNQYPTVSNSVNQIFNFTGAYKKSYIRLNKQCRNRVNEAIINI